MSRGGGFGRRWLAAYRAEGDLSSVEEFGAVADIDCTDEHSVRDAGDKVADVFISGERRHGTAVGWSSSEGGTNLALGFLEFRLVNAFPGVHTAGDGGVFRDGAGFFLRAWGWGGFSGFGHAGFSFGGRVPAALLHCAGRKGNFLQVSAMGSSQRRLTENPVRLCNYIVVVVMEFTLNRCSSRIAEQIMTPGRASCR